MSDAARSIPRVVSAESGAKETRNQQFRRIATKRVHDAESKIDKVGALSTRRNAYSEEEARAMIAALRARVDAAEQRLMPKIQPAFSFDDDE